MSSAAPALALDGALSPIFELAQAARLELFLIIAFGLLWVSGHIFGFRVGGLKLFTKTPSRKGVPSSPAKSVGRAAPGDHARRAAGAAAVTPARRHTDMARLTAHGPSGGGDAGGHGEPAPPIPQNPTAEQLRDATWVASAVQQLSRAHTKRALDLYREAVRAGLDLSALPPSHGAELFLGLTTSALRLSQPEEALQLLRDCRRKGPGVSSALLASATRLCTSKQFFKSCLDIYDFVAQDKTLVVDDRTVWSCLIFCAVETRQFHRCSFFFDRLKTFGTPSQKDYSNMIRYASTQADWQMALSLIQQMSEANLQVDNVVYNTALAACVLANEFDKACLLLEQMEAIDGTADVITYNTLAKGYAKAGRLDKCFELYDHMQAKGIAPSQVTFGILLDCCINERQMDKGLEVFNSMASQGCVMNTVLYTTMIKGFARSGEVDKAMEVYQRMRGDTASGVAPDVVTFSILIKAYCDSGRLEKALGLLEGMMELQLCPDDVIFNNLLAGCVQEGNNGMAKRLYRSMVEGGVRPSNATFSVMLRMHVTSKQLDEALEFLSSEPSARGVAPEARLYLQLAQACMRERQGRRAAQVYKQMLEQAPPTSMMTGSLLNSCVKLNMLGTGADLLTLAADAGAQVDVQDAEGLHEAALRKKKDAFAEEISAALAKLRLAGACAGRAGGSERAALVLQ